MPERLRSLTKLASAAKALKQEKPLRSMNNSLISRALRYQPNIDIFD